MSRDLLIGIHAVEAALQHDAANIIELYVDGGSSNDRLKQLVALADKLGIRAQARAPKALDKLGSGGRHQGIVAVYRTPPPRSENELPELIETAGTTALFLVLDGVTDPHNLGACLRSAAAANVTAVIVPKDRAVGITPVVRRASAGAADRVPLIAATNLARTLRDLKDAGIWLTGLAGDAETSVYTLDWTGPTALVLGSEGEGMRRLTRDQCDHLASIPMPGTMESLNVSVAAGIVLFEALRQRGGEA